MHIAYEAQDVGPVDRGLDAPVQAVSLHESESLPVLDEVHGLLVGRLSYVFCRVFPVV